MEDRLIMEVNYGMKLQVDVQANVHREFSVESMNHPQHPPTKVPYHSARAMGRGSGSW